MCCTVVYKQNKGVCYVRGCEEYVLFLVWLGLLLVSCLVILSLTLSLSLSLLLSFCLSVCLSLSLSLLLACLLSLCACMRFSVFVFILDLPFPEKWEPTSIFENHWACMSVLRILVCWFHFWNIPGNILWSSLEINIQNDYQVALKKTEYTCAGRHA